MSMEIDSDECEHCACFYEGYPCCECDMRDDEWDEDD